MAKLPLWPLRGFINSRPRQTIPLNAITSESKDWLVGRQRYRRRSGRTIFGDTLTSGHETSGILESKWGAKARRMVSAAIKSIADAYPVPLILYVAETIKAATLAWRNTDSSTWKTVGKGFNGTSYPNTGVPTHRVVNMIYENEHGGVTMHRLNTAEYREHAFAGSRDFVQVGSEVALPCYNGVPVRWDTAGDRVFPTGLIPPLMMPTVTIGKDYGTSTVKSWRGADCFYYSVCFENEKGELSMFTIPRPPGSAWSGYPGFGYVEVDSSNLGHYFESVTYANIPDGPPGTRWKRLLRSYKVDVTATGAGAVVQPSLDTLAFFARIPQGTTTYIDTNGNDLSLDPDPRIQEMFKNGGLIWPPRARSMGRFDGHLTLGNLRPSPCALLVAPWDNGNLNLPIDDAGLYGATSYFVAITPNDLYLRSVTGGSNSDTIIPLAGLTLRDLVDRITSDASYSDVTKTNCDYTAGAHAINTHVLNPTLAIGDEVISSDFPSGTKIIGWYGSPLYGVLTSANATSSGTGQTVTFRRRTGGTDITWAAQVVPGADADELAENLQRTYIGASCRFSIAAGTTVTTTDTDYISPGMLVMNGSGGTNPWPAGTYVVSVGASSFVASHAPTRDDVGALETVDIGYDTGDTTLGLLPGFVRAFGNAFPMLCYWSQDYLSQFSDSQQDSTMTAASPGYAQDGLNTWLVRNRRSGPAVLGPLMGFADLGPYELHFYAKGRMRLWNPRTGTTHNDEDYTKVMTSWTRGARSPYAICGGNGWAIFLSDDGFYVCSAAEGTDRLISLNIYDPAAQAGSRGELEYALGACIAASEAGTDDYKIAAQVIGSVLRVRYYKDASSTDFDREIRYDFSDSAGRDGISEVLMSNGDPYPWSAPLTLPVSCSALVTKADGVHHYAAINSNAGTADGRVDEIDTGTTDNGTLVTPVAYTGLHIPDDLNEIQPESAYVVSTKAGAGLEVELTRTPEVDPALAEWDKLEIPTSGPDDFGRSVRHLQGAERLRRSAIGVKIYDDGTGTCPEVSEVLIKTTDVQSTTGNRRAGR